MAAAAHVVNDDVNDHDSSDDDSSDEWGWNAVKNWWNPSCNKRAKKAETKLCNEFIDKQFYEYESKDVAIDYDPVPLSIRKKQAAKRSKSFSGLFSFNNDDNNDGPWECINADDYKPTKLNPKHRQNVASMSTSVIPKAKIGAHLTDNKQTNKNSKNCKKNTSSLNKQSIHTLIFKIKQNKLQQIIKNVEVKKQKQEHIHDDDEDSDEEFYRSPDENELDNDGQLIEGKSMDKYYERTINQQGSSTLLTLTKQLTRAIETVNKSKNDEQISTVSKKSIPPIVLTHGYGCAGGIYIPSIAIIFETILASLRLSESPTIYVLDYLGNGMSSRPEFQCETTEEAEDWFVESLEEWRKTMKIDRFILAGHSLGGYTAAVYAMRYPMNIDHLILISPCGVPARPSNAEESLKNYSWKVRTMFKTFAKLWSSGWTPHDIVRISGPKGKSLIKKVVQRRLFRLDDNNPLKSLLAEYLYQIIAQPGSGEYALSKILQPGAWAHNPIGPRIGVLRKHQKNVFGYNDDDDELVFISSNDLIEIEEKQEEKKMDNDDSDSDSDSDTNIDVENVLNSTMKIDFIYGETDWMTSGHAVKLKKNNIIKCDVYINPHCGHQLILENSQGFAKLFGAVVAKGQILSNND